MGRWVRPVEGSDDQYLNGLLTDPALPFGISSPVLLAAEKDRSEKNASGAALLDRCWEMVLRSDLTEMLEKSVMTMMGRRWMMVLM